jgi:sulfite exporter TauE/SafE
MNYFVAAISLGFMGSFHCVGMCGPIALALPVKQNSFTAKLASSLFYNIGRIFTYALIGGLFGLIGESFAIAGYQQTVSIALGVAILIMVLLPNQVVSRYRITSFIASYVGKLKQQLGLLFQKNSYPSLFFIGTLNGLLPCGLVYLGIAGAISRGNSMEGALFMSMFGLGTLPTMLALPLLGNTISINFRNKINKAVPLFVSLMAILLILRGLNLGIPYVSPQLSAEKPVAHKCCHK